METNFYAEAINLLEEAPTLLAPVWRCLVKAIGEEAFNESVSLISSYDDAESAFTAWHKSFRQADVCPAAYQRQGPKSREGGRDISAFVDMAAWHLVRADREGAFFSSVFKILWERSKNL